MMFVDASGDGCTQTEKALSVADFQPQASPKNKKHQIGTNKVQAKPPGITAGQVPSNLHHPIWVYFNEWSGLAIRLAVRVEAAVVLPWVSSIANLSQQAKISAIVVAFC